MWNNFLFYYVCFFKNAEISLKKIFFSIFRHFLIPILVQKPHPFFLFYWNHQRLLNMRKCMWNLCFQEYFMKSLLEIPLEMAFFKLEIIYFSVRKCTIMDNAHNQWQKTLKVLIENLTSLQKHFLLLKINRFGQCILS